jgi:uncharacterized membrane protein YkoI
MPVIEGQNEEILMKITYLFLALVAGISVQLKADEIDREEIIYLVDQGKILPLEAILSHYPENEYGKILDLEVEKKHGRIRYEIEFLHEDGRVIELKIDASNGQILKRELKD